MLSVENKRLCRSGAGEPPGDVESTRLLLLQIACSLVPASTPVEVRISTEGSTTTMVVLTTPEHLGRLVGEQGRIARSIRTILTAVSLDSNQRYGLDIRPFEI